MSNVGALVLMATMGLTAAAYFVVYRWQKNQRARQVEQWVREFLSARYGELPKLLHIHCSDDLLWPVLVHFATPHTGMQRRLQFSVGAAKSTFALLSEKEEMH